MAELTDEEKTKLAFNDVETSKEVDETKEDDTGKSDDESKAEVEDKSDEASTEEQSKEEDKSENETSLNDSLTKPFPWLKGEQPDDWTKELATAYENSTNEALRLKKQHDDDQVVIEEAKKIIANASQENQATDQQAVNPPVNPLTAPAAPETQYAKTLMEQDMVKSFDSFAKTFPQAREPGSFEQIEKVSPASAQVFLALNGRQPTYAELFDQIAKDLNWQPPVDTSKKDTAIKENASAASTPQSTSSRPPVKGAKISEEQLAVARRIFPGKSDEEILKDLPNYVT